MHPPAALLKAALMHNKMGLEDGYDAIDQVLPMWPVEHIPAPLAPGLREGRSSAGFDRNGCLQALLSFEILDLALWRDTDASINLEWGGKWSSPTSQVFQRQRDSQRAKGRAMGLVPDPAGLQEFIVGRRGGSCC